MDAKRIDEICCVRLGEWQLRLREENATPALCVGIGRGDKSGNLVVCSVADLTNAQIKALLMYALKHLGD
jgi:hypothetical protein